MNQTKINGKTYKVEIVSSLAELTRANNMSNGWDGNFYMLTGKRGAVYGAYRNKTTGEFVIACNAR